MSKVETLKYFVNGQWLDSKTDRFMDVHNPSTGEVIAKAPCCTEQEVQAAITAARNAFPAWSDTPAIKRAQIMFRIRELLIKHEERLTALVARENGKAWGDALGDVLKAKEGTELACSVPTLLAGENLLDASAGIDTNLYREPIGVFAGIVPFNFPAMIPMGWMAPLCIASGNTMVIKAASMTPLTCMEIAKLYQEAGVPEGVINIVTCSRHEADLLLTNPDVNGVSFVGSTSVGLHVYSKAAAHGKRVQALCEAKNHALVLADAPVNRTAAGIINAAFGCAGERCMALPVVVVQEEIADQLIAAVVEKAKALKVGPGYLHETDMGPVVSAEHKKSVEGWITKGVEEGAKLVLDGRGYNVAGYEEGYYVGPTVFDHVTEEMSIGTEEIFGPVLCFKRVKTFDEGLTLMNQNPFANGSVIFTQNGYYAREFQKRTHGGMVGINVGIPVPVGVFPFSGHKHSFFGDLHCLGKDGVRFYTESKCVTSRWFDEEEIKREKVDSWDGTI
ncbi:MULTISPECIES: CoA-acylating methylmalonate-semialdehyde dehydrogenase [unclassified Brenneria]|uniref:CoA-acylating methylmalonate-semialdehyde dehydrogenase n=1 Tax=unclassified Brenneria TaxID=2634434 RepID=UPI0015562535|nr:MULTISPECIES: CoA-acylating methylmalonate-semialdehyde dehydrogenase [unclassified Brenneria]MBJ7221025.1 CoA-acylating methylmalonate-semialdehyde dehydrogenase [Brenneria sp. L3-3C-1]MEE3642266.1 CoA-acylating methylmalonate-semialdehyde dehydrogenase [Brenneria sp. L3_3C_1]MEE3650362.1 CoA-acylating methylmalonate-semialdehyde dehydrogenase [Brenneria sp. HEZEL_4_2_4]NPD00318.1 CoA-acylating methylmalonate-semialdehyde dehydrogenase [Brenneria sp. hezel4-2-4]